MKAIILGGGLGKRLSPLTDPLNKHLLPVYDCPMIVHVIRTLVRAGISDILLLLNGRYPGLFLEMLEDGRSFNCHLTYRYTRSVDGPGRTLLMAERWIDDQDFAVILGDSIYFITLPIAQKTAPHIFTMPLDDFDDHTKYGQVIIDGNRVTAIVWKPITLFSNIIQTGCFILPSNAFIRLRRLSDQTAGEVSITALTRQYVEEGLMTHTILPPRSYLD